jgi:predicted Fe-S protein YdhL (DUF1289 family)
MTAEKSAIATPCIRVCVVDGASGLCVGCLRSLSEIAAWTSLTDDERGRIMGELPARRGLVDPGKLAAR